MKRVTLLIGSTTPINRYGSLLIGSPTPINRGTIWLKIGKPSIKQKGLGIFKENFRNMKSNECVFEFSQS